MKEKKTKRVFWEIIKSVILFFFIYDILLKGVPSIFSTRKIAFVCMLGIAFYQYYARGVRRDLFVDAGIKKSYLTVLLVTLLSVPYLFVLVIINECVDSVGREYPYVVYFCVFALISPIVIMYFFDTKEEFFKSVGNTAIFQSVFIWFEYAVIPFKEWLQEHIYSTGGIKFIAVDRATGLGATGSALTVILAFSIFVIGRLILESEHNFKYWCITFFVMIAQFLSGRTGFYISVLNVGLILFCLLIKRRQIWHNLGKAVLVLLIVIVGFVLWINIARTSEERIEYIINRNTNVNIVFSTGDDSFYDNFSTGEANGTLADYIWGTGINYGETNKGVRIKNDSGYLKRYIAEGVFFATAEYVSLLLLMLILLRRIKGGCEKFYYFWMIAVLYVIEIKEPFMFYYVNVAMILTVLIYAQDGLCVDMKGES